MHAGKTTVSDVLTNERKYQQAKFAGPVKTISAEMVNTLWAEVARVVGMTWDKQTAADLEQSKDAFRTLFQFVGEYGRTAFGENVWVDIFRNQYADKNGEFQGPLVVDDVRYPNEARFLLDNGFRLVLITRPEESRVQSVLRSFVIKHGRNPKKKELKEILKHGSETGVDDIQQQRLFTSEITNNGGLTALQALARGLH